MDVVDVLAINYLQEKKTQMQSSVIAFLNVASALG